MSFVFILVFIRFLHWCGFLTSSSHGHASSHSLEGVTVFFALIIEDNVYFRCKRDVW